jgi:uncharacterized protein YkwD
MGIESRDWYREAPRRPRRSRRGWLLTLALVASLVLGLVEVERLRQSSEGVYSGERQSRPGDLKLSLLPGLPAITLEKGSLYPPHDLWKSYLADEKTCPGGENADAPVSDQANTMVCLVNYAREQRGLQALAPVALLNATSVKKADKIVRCQDFAHAACGIDPAADARAAGYRGNWGENLYMAEGELGAPRVALDGWLNSPGHRENLFRPEWRTEGIAVTKTDHIGSYSKVTLWVNEFGTG